MCSYRGYSIVQDDTEQSYDVTQHGKKPQLQPFIADPNYEQLEHVSIAFGYLDNFSILVSMLLLGEVTLALYGTLNVVSRAIGWCVTWQVPIAVRITLLLCVHAGRHRTDI